MFIRGDHAEEGYSCGHSQVEHMVVRGVGRSQMMGGHVRMHYVCERSNDHFFLGERGLRGIWRERFSNDIMLQVPLILHVQAKHTLESVGIFWIRSAEQGPWKVERWVIWCFCCSHELLRTYSTHESEFSQVLSQCHSWTEWRKWRKVCSYTLMKQFLKRHYLMEWLHPFCNLQSIEKSVF